MRLVTYDDIELRLSESDWKQLLIRFDHGLAELNCFGYYHLPSNSICAIRKYRCNRCPFHDPHKEVNSCTYLLRRIIGDENFKYLLLFDTAVIWESKHDKEVRQALQKVFDILSTAAKYGRESADTTDTN